MMCYFVFECWNGYLLFFVFVFDVVGECGDECFLGDFDVIYYFYVFFVFFLFFEEFVFVGDVIVVVFCQYVFVDCMDCFMGDDVCIDCGLDWYFELLVRDEFVQLFCYYCVVCVCFVVVYD